MEKEVDDDSEMEEVADYTGLKEAEDEGAVKGSGEEEEKSESSLSLVSISVLIWKAKIVFKLFVIVLSKMRSSIGRIDFIKSLKAFYWDSTLFSFHADPIFFSSNYERYRKAL